jgi:hypothetical protein
LTPGGDPSEPIVARLASRERRGDREVVGGIGGEQGEVVPDGAGSSVKEKP